MYIKKNTHTQNRNNARTKSSMVAVSIELLRPDTVRVRYLSGPDGSESCRVMVTAAGASFVTCTQLSMDDRATEAFSAPTLPEAEPLPLLDTPVEVVAAAAAEAAAEIAPLVLSGVATGSEEGMAGTPLEPPANTFARFAIMSFALTVS